MSHPFDDDDALDAALRQLGSPDGSAPLSSPAEILGRVPAPTVPPVAGPVAGARTLLRGGLAGGRLAAAVVLAVGAGFGGGMLTQRGLQSAPEPVAAEAVKPAETEGPAVPTPPLAAASEATGGTQVLDSAAAVTTPQPLRSSARHDAGARPRHCRDAGALVTAAPVPATGVRGMTADEARGSAELARADLAGVISGGVASVPEVMRNDEESGSVPSPMSEAPAESEDPSAVALSPRATRKPARGEAPAVVERERPGSAGPPVVLTAGLGAALSRLPPQLDREDGLPAEAPESRVGPFAAVGATWRGTGAPRVGYAGLAVEGGRLYAEDHALTSAGVAATAGVSWERAALRADLGGTLGLRTVWGHPPGDPARDEADAGTVADAGDPDPATESRDRGEDVRGSRLSLGPTLGLALGTAGSTRWSLQVAPQVALARAARPSPWVQLSLGCELPVFGDGG